VGKIKLVLERPVKKSSNWYFFNQSIIGNFGKNLSILAELAKINYTKPSVKNTF